MTVEAPEQRRERLARVIFNALVSDGLDFRDMSRNLQEFYRKAADAIIASDEAAGLVVVPVEPTERMIRAGWVFDDDVRPDDIYAAMIAAAKE